MLKAILEMTIGSVVFLGVLNDWNWSLLSFVLLIVSPIMFLGGLARALIWLAAQARRVREIAFTSVPGTDRCHLHSIRLRKVRSRSEAATSRPGFGFSLS